MIRVAFSVFKTYWRVVILMIFFFAITVFALLMLNGFRDSANRLFQTIDQEYLIIHEQDTLAEFYGSRISTQIGDQLAAMGCSQVIPAIHSATGTAGRNYQFVLGVDPEQYKQVEAYELVAGRDLRPGDQENLAMIGLNVAESEGIQIGERVELRGRYFNVVGIFNARSFANNEVWIYLTAAQKLLGWGSDVSYYLVPNEGILEAGEKFTENTMISQRGESIASATREYFNVLEYFSTIVLITGIGTAFAFGNIVFRLASIQKYELAVLRALGFSKIQVNFNFIFQAAIIFLCGYSLALMAALIFPHLYQISIFDLVIMPDLSVKNIMLAFLLLASLGAISITIPLVWIYRSNLSNLLRSE